MSTLWNSQEFPGPSLQEWATEGEAKAWVSRDSTEHDGVENKLPLAIRECVAIYFDFPTWG